ncbi:SOS response-associated peptidase [Geminicoccus harenae]|uniref:SOS response-associated peptidase n=1 Tax=Geminicoccus harenae TaxID=2498453 RepID=UPI00168B1B7A|nr:SOS response-associated peptidase [Geminicoccus harenae]
MCNLYSLTKGQDAIRAFTRAMRDTTGNLPLLPAIFPDRLAPVVHRAQDGTRELAMMRWGFPPPPNLGGRPVTNIRNLASPYWRGWLKPGWRCLVPASSFCEYTDSQPKVPHWFALDPSRPLFAFAGLWRPWSGTRGTKAEPAEGEHRLFAFLTCPANDVVRPIHAKAMPVLLTTQEECDTWLEGTTEDALALQRPLPDTALQVVATGQREDGLREDGPEPSLPF